jgi:hypothetical protein
MVVAVGSAINIIQEDRRGIAQELVSYKAMGMGCIRRANG